MKIEPDKNEIFTGCNWTETLGFEWRLHPNNVLFLFVVALHLESP